MSRTTFYDLVHPLYPLVDLFLASQKRRMFQEIRDFAPGILLEVGAGNGSHRELVSHIPTLGCDPSLGMLRKARRTNSPSFQAALADGFSLPVADDSVDAVSLSHVVGVVSDPGGLIAESIRVLRPGGRLWILNHFTPDSVVGWFDHLVRPVGPLLGLKTVLRPRDIPGLGRLRPLGDAPLGWLSYYRLLTFSKP